MSVIKQQEFHQCLLALSVIIIRDINRIDIKNKNIVNIFNVSFVEMTKLILSIEQIKSVPRKIIKTLNEIVNKSISKHFWKENSPVYQYLQNLSIEKKKRNI